MSQNGGGREGEMGAIPKLMVVVWKLFLPYCGLVGNPHLTAKHIFVAPLPTSTKSLWCSLPLPTKNLTHGHTAVREVAIKQIPQQKNIQDLPILVGFSDRLVWSEIDGFHWCGLVECPSCQGNPSIWPLFFFFNQKDTYALVSS